MTTLNNIYEIDKNNKIIGHYPQIINSTIKFSGSNNILYCEENVKLENSTLTFSGDNSIIWLSSNKYDYKLSVNIFNDSIFYMGKNNFINQTMTIILSEHKHCFIGDNCIFSTNITMRNADPHLIYNCSDGHRINFSKSIFIGDHVWVGQDSRILKGSSIDSGSIIGAMSVIPGKKILHNSIWAGNPCRKIKDNIFWDTSCVHDWNDEKTEKSMLYSEYLSEYRDGYNKDFWIYNYNASECIEWQELEKHFSSKISPKQKCDYLMQIDKSKNRFVHK